MENKSGSDVDGIVDDVLGQQGQQVKKRQMLFTIQI
jgi:geranyl-CoA carboxylase alpha subunit